MLKAPADFHSAINCVALIPCVTGPREVIAKKAATTTKTLPTTCFSSARSEEYEHVTGLEYRSSIFSTDAACMVECVQRVRPQNPMAFAMATGAACHPLRPYQAAGLPCAVMFSLLPVLGGLY